MNSEKSGRHYKSGENISASHDKKEIYVKPRLNEFGKIADLTAGGSQTGSELMRDGRIDARRAGRMS
jgi:hypothetical protein